MPQSPISDAACQQACQAWADKAVQAGSGYREVRDILFSQLGGFERFAASKLESVAKPETIAAIIAKKIGPHAEALREQGDAGEPAAERAACAAAMGAADLLRSKLWAAGKHRAVAAQEELAVTLARHPGLSQRLGVLLLESPDGHNMAGLNPQVPGQVAGAFRRYMENASPADAAILVHKLSGLDVPEGLYRISEAETRRAWRAHEALEASEPLRPALLQTPNLSVARARWKSEWQQDKQSDQIVDAQEMRRLLGHIATDLHVLGLSTETAQTEAKQIGMHLSLKEALPDAPANFGQPRKEHWNHAKRVVNR